MIADIASGNLEAADVCFLVALVLAVVAAFVSVRPQPRWDAHLPGWLAVAALALGWLLL